MMNVKVGQVWRSRLGVCWLVLEGAENGRLCECLSQGSSTFAVGSRFVVSLTSASHWTLVRDVEPQCKPDCELNAGHVGTCGKPTATIVEPQVPQAGETWEFAEYTPLAGQRRIVVGRSRFNCAGWDCLEGPNCFDDAEIERGIIRRISPAPSAPAPKPPEPAKPWRSDKERGPSVAIPEHIDKAMRARNDEFHERHKERLKAVLASLGSEGFTVRVPSKGWDY